MSQIDFEPPAAIPGLEPPPEGSPTGDDEMRDGIFQAHPRHAEPTLGEKVVSTGPWLWVRVKDVGKKAADNGNDLRRFFGSFFSAVTGLGWTVLATAGLAWVIGASLGWAEAGIVAVVCLVAILLAALFTIGNTNVEVDLALSPRRVVVHQSALASFTMTNVSPRRQGSVRVRLEVGQSAAHFAAPGLEPGESYGESVTIPAEKRAVIPVGPVITYRQDPLGLVRREVAWTKVQELFIHPEIVPLPEIGTGLLRDLEGLSTQDVSNSDLAFHTLREYVPGDDRRFIHWRSSARLSSATGEDIFLIRQFLDTRKSHICVVSDLHRDHFSSEDEFEVSLSCAASIAARTIMDGMDLTVLCGDQVLVRPTSNFALDPYSRAAMGLRSLAGEFERVRAQAPDASTIAVVTGALTGFDDLQRGRTVVPDTVNMLVIRVAMGADIGLRQTSTFTELTVGCLADLPRAVMGGMS